MWSGFAFFWEASVILMGAPLIFKLWGIPFVVMGLYILIGRFFARAWQLSETFYVVTTHRILFYSRNGMSFITYSKIPSLEKYIQKNGMGTIYLGPYTKLNSTSIKVNPLEGKALEDIPDAERVYHMIEEKMLEVQSPER